MSPDHLHWDKMPGEIWHGMLRVEIALFEWALAVCMFLGGLWILGWLWQEVTRDDEEKAEREAGKGTRGAGARGAAGPRP